MEIVGLTARATSFIRRLQLHPHIFNQFQRVMKDYSTDKLNVAAVVSELDILFQYQPELLTEYRVFLSPQLQATLPPPQQSPNNKCVTEPDLEMLKRCIEFMNKVQKRFANERGVIFEYLGIIRELTQGKICNKESYNKIEKIFGNENQDLVDGFEWLILGRKGIKKQQKEEKKKNSSSPSNSGDEIKARNRMEDEMFELDINLSRRKTSMDSANMLMESLEEDQQIINIDNYFSAVSLGYIKKVYKEEGSAIITRLWEDPTTVLPQILEKLESNEEVLIKKWRDLHEKKKNPIS